MPLQGRARSAAGAEIRKILFVLSTLGVSRVLFEIAPDMSCCIFSAAGMGFFGEDGINQVVEFLDRIGFFVFQQRADGLVDHRRPLEDGVFIAAPFFFEKDHTLIYGCRVLAFYGGQVFVLHFQHDVDLLVLQLFVEGQESLQVDRIGVGARPFSGRLLGVMNFLLAVRCFPSFFNFGDPVWVSAS